MSLLGVKRTWRFALHMSAFDPKRTCFALTNPEERAHCGGPEKGRSMALDTNTFLMVLAAAIIVMGIVVWVMFKKAA